MSISAISSIATAPSSVLTQALETIQVQAGALSTGVTSTGGSTLGTSASTLALDMAALLKALLVGDVAGAKADLAKVQADLKAQGTGTAGASNGLANDTVSLVSAFAAKDASGVQTNLALVEADLKSQADSISSFTARLDTSGSGNLLDNLLTQVSGSIASGSSAGGIQAVISYLVQSGNGSGNLVNTTA